METPVLAPDYYLANFQRLVRHTLDYYSDLLTKSEHDWIQRFQQLDHDSQCLLVRLMSRKGKWFRSDKLSYDEIASTLLSLDALQEANFVLLSPDLGARDLSLSVLTKPEVLALFPELNKGLSKGQLIETLSDEVFDYKGRLAFTVVELLADEVIDVLLILFFANRYQDLSQFVLEDLGLHRFEDYPLSVDLRFFNSREDIEQLRAIGAVAEAHYLMGSRDSEQLKRWLEALPDEVNHRHVLRQKQRCMNAIARDLEREKLYPQAIATFEQAQIPPSRERLARIYDALDDVDSMQEWVTLILDAPWDVSEFEVAQRLEARLKRKQGIKVPRAEKPKVDELRLDLDLSQQRVEIATLEHLTTYDNQVLYAENTLFNALFGLAFWDVIFAPVEGAFVNAYQHRPKDLYRREFAQKRQHEIDEVFSRIESGSIDYIVENYDRKVGISNPFVSWKVVSKEWIETALVHIPMQHLSEIFKVMLTDLKLYRTGFPDLIVFRHSGASRDYELVEVKGPGDKLQDNQWRWIRQFQRIGVPVSVCYVNQ
nr:VRR-NUC domain-containing protein [Vibrio maerlii]